MNNDKFRRNIQKRIDEAKGKQKLFIKKLTLELLKRVVLKSPVDTGRFRNNWMIGNGSVDMSTSIETDKSGTGSILRGASEVNSINVNGQIIYISNSLPYAKKLEFGSSKQAPAGMVRVTLAEIHQAVRNVAFEVRKS